ncbi:MAG: hypothetical protein WBA17_03850 [Saprospiraceae bacterium]
MKLLVYPCFLSLLLNLHSCQEPGTVSLDEATYRAVCENLIKNNTRLTEDISRLRMEMREILAVEYRKQLADIILPYFDTIPAISVKFEQLIFTQLADRNFADRSVLVEAGRLYRQDTYTFLLAYLRRNDEVLSLHGRSVEVADSYLEQLVTEIITIPEQKIDRLLLLNMLNQLKQNELILLQNISYSFCYRPLYY